MKTKYKLAILILLCLVAVFLFALFLRGRDFALLNPKGAIALQERNLIVIAILLMLIVVIPVFILTFFIAWKYRASNKKASYTPNWVGNVKLELLWWAIPGAIIFALSIINWKSTHALDPYKPITSDAKPIMIQVVALQWKWLFMYPEQNIATVNFIQFPVGTPINFKLTADAPMNSFWIPQLGGQMYAMPGMSTQLHLIADKAGEFNGSAAEINGAGFAGMKFVAKASSQSDFNNWVASVKQSPRILDLVEYNALAEPSENNPVAYYVSAEKDLYNKIIMKLMAPTPSSTSMPGMQNMGM